MSVTRTIQGLCAITLLSGCLFSQSTTGTLLGTVTDPGEAAVAGARVELRNAATGAVIATTTGAEGIFRFNSLVPATYTLTIRAAAGFKTYLQIRYRRHGERSARSGETVARTGRDY